MNIIIGVINSKYKMTISGKILTGSLLLFFISCKVQKNGEETDIRPHSDVLVTYPVIKDAEVIEEFQGITRYIQTIEIRAHVTGIISEVNVSLADKVIAKLPLFEIKPRETSLLESSDIKSEFIKSVTDTVFAFSPGIINQINVQPGDFVQEGDLLASCVNQNSLRVVVSVPLEMDVTKIQHQPCSVLFPDNKIFTGSIGPGLPSVNETDQTNAFLIKLDGNPLISENIHVKVNIKTSKISEGVFLPVDAVYGNEEQNRFWVLKINNDSIAVRVPVIKGIKIDSFVQVLGVDINTSDRIIYKGGYALSDSALVNIITPNSSMPL
jgi:hypothetical protein